MAGIISNVDSDVQKLRKLKNEIENVKKALMGINIKVDIDIAKGLQSQLTSLLGQYDVLVDKIAAAEGKIMLSVVESIKQPKRLSKHKRLYLNLRLIRHRMEMLQGKQIRLKRKVFGRKQRLMMI